MFMFLIQFFMLKMGNPSSKSEFLKTSLFELGDNYSYQPPDKEATFK